MVVGLLRLSHYLVLGKTSCLLSFEELGSSRSQNGSSVRIKCRSVKGLPLCHWSFNRFICEVDSVTGSEAISDRGS